MGWSAGGLNSLWPGCVSVFTSPRAQRSSGKDGRTVRKATNKYAGDATRSHTKGFAAAKKVSTDEGNGGKATNNNTTTKQDTASLLRHRSHKAASRSRPHLPSPPTHTLLLPQSWSTGANLKLPKNPELNHQTTSSHFNSVGSLEESKVQSIVYNVIIEWHCPKYLLMNLWWSICETETWSEWTVGKSTCVCVGVCVHISMTVLFMAVQPLNFLVDI